MYCSLNIKQIPSWDRQIGETHNRLQTCQRPQTIDRLKTQEGSEESRSGLALALNFLKRKTLLMI